MALSNAERQTRWRNRLKEAAAAAADPDQVSENAALRARVATLEAALATAQAGHAAAQAAPVDGDALARAQARITELEAALARKTKNFNAWLATIKARKGLVFSKDEFAKILACLHPDSRAGLSDKRLAEAFDLFNSRKLVLYRDAKL
jgi:hypothetical protein